MKNNGTRLSEKLLVWSRNRATVVLAGALVLVGGATCDENGKLTLHPSAFGRESLGAWKAHEGLPDSEGNANQALYLQKAVPTATFAAGVVVINGIEGQPASALAGLSWERRGDGHCSAVAPRWVIGLTDGTHNFTVFLGCAEAPHTAGNGPGWTRDSYSGEGVGVKVQQQTGSTAAGLTITSLAIVFDEGTDRGEGFVYLDNITVGHEVWTSPADNHFALYRPGRQKPGAISPVQIDIDNQE